MLRAQLIERTIGKTAMAGQWQFAQAIAEGLHQNGTLPDQLR